MTKKRRINSNAKGKRGEREFAKVCRDYGYTESRRGVQYNGLEGEDVVGIPDVFIEVKRVDTITLPKWLEKLHTDKESNHKPWSIIAMRPNRKRWLICMPMDEFKDKFNTFDIQPDKITANDISYTVYHLDRPVMTHLWEYTAEMQTVTSNNVLFTFFVKTEKVILMELDEWFSFLSLSSD